MRILVTGAAGFIGRHIAVEARLHGHDVRAVSRRAVELPDVECVQHDLCNAAGIPRLLDRVDAVVHCAASLAGGVEAQQTETVGATSNLLAAMAQSSATTVVHLSTMALYDYSIIPAHSELTELSPLDDGTHQHPYILAKRQQEQMVRQAALAGGWRWAILRPGLVFGPGRTWFHQLGTQLSRRLWLSVAPRSPLPLCYVEHCADAVVRALDAATASGVTANLIDDDLPPRAAYISMLAKHTRPQPIVVGLPWSLLSAAAAAAHSLNRTIKGAGGRLSLPDLITPDRLAARCKPLRYPNAHARAVLGWRPRRSMAEALERSLRS